MRSICLLGATGSIGSAVLAIAAQQPERYRLRIVAGGSDAVAMAALCRTHRPALALLADKAQAAVLESLLAGEGIEVAGGSDAICAAAADESCDTVVAAIAGARGVEPALAAARSGKRLLLANKEALIVAGRLLMTAVQEGGGELLPIDSEHCALFELLHRQCNYNKLWLTSSGGSVRDVPLDRLTEVTPEQALAHPNWSMGKKITIDSATMMNKVLEIIEAAFLFAAPAERIGAVIHPQSICHALVEGSDGSLMTSWSAADMRLPIARMLHWPDSAPLLLPPLDWQALSAASFAAPDEARYPCLPLAYAALVLGGGAPAALSAANEVAVEHFLAGAIKFTDIARINISMMDDLHGRQTASDNMEDIWQMDTDARRFAMGKVSC